MEQVRFSGRPHEELDVTAAEAKDLRRMGVLVEDGPTENAPPSNKTPGATADK